ncbi:hypothetical protein F5984_06215 [Rudanella paleaurantiibacter]|uniref:PPM-type phosphatase domain-containing protein n=1 Tax=Rudanella paleaurantiibacter TaxID=2614655 RepID=A0A7J5U2E8_9BACT|nr:hypothetical protein F5984_06215 [Rudanella paleaurantiibacter]
MQSQEYIYQSVKGVGKSENQDNSLIIEERDFNLFAVFDGVSSAVNSKKGTDLAKEYITSHYRKFVNEDAVDLCRLMYSCNEYMLASNIPSVYTTYCIAVIYKDGSGHSYFSTMGDTRLYIITNQYINQVSKDDTIHPNSNTIMKCLGMNYLDSKDFTQDYFIRENQFVLLCSDGFYSFLEGDRMTFFDYFNRKTLKSIQININSCIKNNLDDSTYIFIR